MMSTQVTMSGGTVRLDPPPSRWPRRTVPTVFAALLVGTGLLYTFCWNSLWYHANAWVQPQDIWDAFKVAHLVAWGDFGDIYSVNGFLTFPGIAVLLAPVAWVTGQLGLHDSFPWYNPHASAWPVLAPISLVIGVLPLFATDALAQFLGVARRRRVALCAAQTVILWPVLVKWGHPEVAIAVGLALYATLAVLGDQSRGAGWLMGLAVIFQPLVLLLLPLVLAVAPVRQRVRILLCSTVPTAVLLLIPVVQAWHNTTTALIKQPTYPAIDHPTPLLVLAPVLSHTGVLQNRVIQVLVHGHLRFVEHVGHGSVVSPGPGRVLALLFALALGMWAAVRHPSPALVLWLGALALSGWCAVEAVMVAYYAWPALALLLLVAAFCDWWRFGLVLGLALFCTVWSEQPFSPWMYWAPLVLALAAALVATWPGSDTAAPTLARSSDEDAPLKMIT